MNNFKEKLTNFYNKFNEDKRLDRRHGQVEFLTTIKYIEDYLSDNDSIIDIGAGAGRYSLYFKNKGYDVTAVEYVRPNIGKIKAKDKDLKVIEASAVDLSMFKDKQFDIAIMFGPMYHLYNKEDKLQALSEAIRVTKKGGVVFSAKKGGRCAGTYSGNGDHRARLCNLRLWELDFKPLPSPKACIVPPN